ncbi:uncharacterized protein LOC5497961 isoform X2 [Nematostella vectensis]|uniref:uncharacterized protein LOC5497961 isoform X2 n=1 Tax=Nematostella vectensis TaxID=45351 RepID=UPI0020776DF3|nr:uncharacterized protein LOC5497961 isoform X2 [Nematostella vectensis]
MKTKMLKVLVNLVFFQLLVIAKADKCDQQQLTKYGFYLRNHKYDAKRVTNLLECLRLCNIDPKCLTINFSLFDKECEFNDDSGMEWELVELPHSIHGILKKEKKASSCNQLKKSYPLLKSGYYDVIVNGKERNVYCDMDNFGGGWSLVVSISKSSHAHLQSSEIDCQDVLKCVPFPESPFPAKKLSDEDIRALAGDGEGTFRVDVVDGPATNNISVFYQIPSGAQNFNSSCSGATCWGTGCVEAECARIIISHSHPYVWESNCKGIDVGYLIVNLQHKVFDGHDNAECGSTWYSSKYTHYGVRALYGYTTPGIHREREGVLFVK